ncbi:MAG: hypothetical protein AB8G23_22100 [Myxococcota bacterium]
MRTRILLAAAAFILLASSLGCTGMNLPGTNTAGPCDPILFIREGTTTQADISARCGPPTTQERTSSGMTWIYNPDAAVSTADILVDSCEGMTGTAKTLCVASIPDKLFMNINFNANGVVTDYTARKEVRQPTPRPAGQ